MLTPFVVKHYPTQDEEAEIDVQQEDELKHVDEEEEWDPLQVENAEDHLP